jgi:hypothetical protein
MSWTGDRWLAAFAVLVTALVLLVTIALSDGKPAVGPEPSPAAVRAAEHRARRDLLDRLRRGASATAKVDYAFRRSTRRGPLRAEIVEVDRPPDHLRTGFGGVTGTWRGRQVDCSSSPAGKVCAPSGPAEPADQQAARALSTLNALSDPGVHWYTVRATGRTRVAGEATHCFLLTATQRARRDVYGRSTELCVTRDGLILANKVIRATAIDATTAVRVTRRVTDADLAGLLAGYPFR